MTQPTDIDTFTQWFDDSAHEAHHREDRTELPSSQVWQLVSTRLPQVSPGEDDMTRIAATNLITISAPGITTTNSAAPIGRHANRPSRHVSGWIAAMVALMLVTSGLYLNTYRNGGGDGETNLAWAPTTVEATPEHACNVAPLTVDEVMEMVLNPRRGYERLGQNTWPADLDELTEFHPTIYGPKLDTSGYREFGNDPALVQEAVDAANVFTTCLSAGTAFQVWALVDPAIVQIDIISRFPVLRTEAELRAFVEETGPLSYAEHGGGYLPRFDGEAIHQGDGNWIIDGPGLHDELAIIPMANVPFDTEDAILNVSLQKFPNGQWIVTAFQYQIPGPRG